MILRPFLRASRRAFRAMAAALFAATLAWAIASPARAATITIINNDGAGEGFNDATAAAPVGDNPGTTVGAQRLYVFQHAANIWGGLLPSAVQIRVNAQFNPQSCTATSGVLGSAGPTFNVRNFPSAPFANTWYHIALANKIAGADQLPASNDIGATFNVSIGQPGCLEQGWYYGVDGNEGSQLELLPVVLHELGHGLGFSTSTNGATGAQMSGNPHIYDRFLLDNTLGLHWNQMNDFQRQASALNCRRLAWDGPKVTAAAPVLLGPKPVLRVNSPGSIDGDYEVGVASFGPALDATGVTADVVLANDGVGMPNNGCEPIVNAVAGKIAFVDRGACGFVVKVKNAQNAGAIGVIVADSVGGCPPVGMSGVDATITIPSVRITLTDGNLIRAQLGSGVNATLRVDPALLAGTDAAGRVLVYASSPYSSGSSISHWDTGTEPSLLMEPALTAALSSSVDMTQAHFADIGWYIPLTGVEGAPISAHRLGASAPNPTSHAATIHYTLAREELVELGIYDLGGRLVNRIVHARVPEGTHAARWNGLDLAGRPVPAGVYVYRLRTPTFDESRHLAVVK